MSYAGCWLHFGFNYSVLRTTRGQCGSINWSVIFQNNHFFGILPRTIVKKVLKCSWWDHWEHERTRTKIWSTFNTVSRSSWKWIWVRFQVASASGLHQRQGKCHLSFTLTQIRSEVSCSGFLQYSPERVRCLFSLVSTKSLMHPPKFMAQVCGKRGWETPPKCFHGQRFL